MGKNSKKMEFKWSGIRSPKDKYTYTIQFILGEQKNEKKDEEKRKLNNKSFSEFKQKSTELEKKKTIKPQKKDKKHNVLIVTITKEKKEKKGKKEKKEKKKKKE